MFELKTSQRDMDVSKSYGTSPFMLMMEKL